MPKIPARYISEREVILPAERGPYFDGYGQPLKPLLQDSVFKQPVYGLRYGDTLMMPDTEILGQTFFVNPETGMTLHLGAGRRILKEHQGLSLDELVNMKPAHYEFMDGRSDFEVFNLTASNSPEKPVEAPAIPEPNTTPVETILVEDVPSVNNDTSSDVEEEV